jgi:RNA polymerase sigma factor (sigma-70 family)
LSHARQILTDATRPAPGAGRVVSPDWLALTSAIRRGDTAAFETLYELWFDRACAMVRARTGRDEAFCLDAVHDAMLRAIRTIRPMRRREDLDRWMARLVHGSALDLLRHERRRVRREHDRPDPIHQTDSPAALVELDEQIAALRAGLRGLSEADGALLRHRFGLGLTLKQIGRVSGLSGHAAHGRIRRAVTKLAQSTREMRDDV